MQNKPTLTTAHAYLALLTAALCFGANPTLARLAVGEVSPMMIVALRWFLVLVLLLAFNAKTLVRDWPNLKPHLGFLFAMGALGFAAFNALFYTAAHHTTAISMGIINGMLPAFVLVGALIAYRTPTTKLQWAGASLTLCGVVVVASGGEIERLLGLRLNDGDLLVVLATLLYAGYAVGLQRRPASTAIGLFSVLAASAFLASLPMVAMEAWSGNFQAPTLQGWVVVGLVALFPSFLAQMMFIRGVEIIGPGRAGIFVNLVPVIAAVIAVAFLGEKFSPHHGIALVFVLGGIWLAESSSKNALTQDTPDK